MQPSPDQFPDYHFLLIAPNLGAEWLFDAARAYWERYKPIVVSDLELPRLVPPENSVIITVVARRDTASQWGVTVAQNVPAALFDPVVTDSFDEMKQALNDRAAQNQPFGVPRLPTPTSPPPIIPTPGSLLAQPPAQPTRPPGGVITETPTPNGAVETIPPPASATPETPEGPIYPTPGPIIGGGS
jgi:hypothetical protein